MLKTATRVIFGPSRCSPTTPARAHRRRHLDRVFLRRVQPNGLHLLGLEIVGEGHVPRRRGRERVSAIEFGGLEYALLGLGRLRRALRVLPGEAVWVRREVLFRRLGPPIRSLREILGVFLLVRGFRRVCPEGEARPACCESQGYQEDRRDERELVEQHGLQCLFVLRVSRSVSPVPKLVEQLLARVLLDPNRAEMRRGREVKPRVIGIERAHVKSRTCVFDEVNVIANGCLGRQRCPDLRQLGLARVPYAASGDLRRRMKRLVEASALDFLRRPFQVERALREYAAVGRDPHQGRGQRRAWDRSTGLPGRTPIAAR